MGDIMVRFIDRTGETRLNNFGSETVIVEYRISKDMDVYFPEYDYIFKGAAYQNFKNGEIKCPYEKRCYGHGFIGEGKHKTKENGKDTKSYRAWYNMLKRCYDPKYHEKRPSYKGCTVDKEWLNFQNFAKWFDENYYEIEGEIMALDKDILVKGNKIYSADTCVFVPHNINSLFTKRDKCRGELPIGVCYNKHNRKFVSLCNIYNYKENKNKQIHLGYYDTPQEAFEVYKQFKEQNIREVANYYRGKIPSKLYDAMCNYEVYITD